ncbi:hypothetical protein TOPH_01468, partial [Tolypocladium ophioglossoides CBS 100239]
PNSHTYSPRINIPTSLSSVTGVPRQAEYLQLKGSITKTRLLAKIVRSANSASRYWTIHIHLHAPAQASVCGERLDVAMFPRSIFGTAAPAPICDVDDLHELLLAVLPAFATLARDIIDGADDATTALRAVLDKSDPRFYFEFYSSIFALNGIFHVTDLARSAQNHTADEEKIRTTLMLVLDELESRFLSRRRLPILVPTGFSLDNSNDETYPKLRALRRSLPEDGATDQTTINRLRDIVRIASSNPAKRSTLLCRLEQANIFSGPQFACPDNNDGLPCPVRFEAYPSKHVRRLANSLHRLLQQRWSCNTSCGCRVTAHIARKTQLSLTAYRHFETAPVHNQISSASQARFRILFPTGHGAFEWQDSQIHVNDQGREDVEHEELNEDLCGVIRNVARGSRLRMLASKGKLWQLRPDLDRPFFKQIQECRLISLRDLLQPGPHDRESKFSVVEARDRLILCFILATSVLHFYQGPWLQQNLSSGNVCFMVPKKRSALDITKPYLTATCSEPCPASDSRTLNNTHRYPRGPIAFVEGEDRCFTALESCDALVEDWQSSGTKAVHDGLIRALSACLEPSWLVKKRLDRKTTKEAQVSRYIFEEIVFPLGEAISIAYGIKLDTLHDEVFHETNNIKKPEEVGHCEEKSNEKQQRANAWFKYLGGTHDFIDHLMDECEHLPHEDQVTAHLTVAVLDTGFQPPEEVTRPLDWETDRDGHGTHVAQILLKVSPMVDVHVARVFEHRRDLEDDKLAAQIHQRIASAISCAAHEWKVDMIVMCFGFAKAIPVIRRAIEDASRSERPPLFFAAIRNDGANENIAWPGRAGEVIGVGSTDGDGFPSSFNPPCAEYPVL